MVERLKALGGQGADVVFQDEKHIDALMHTGQQQPHGDEASQFLGGFDIVCLFNCRLPTMVGIMPRLIPDHVRLLTSLHI